MKPPDRRPPWIGRWLVRLWPLGTRRPEVEADLLELFAIRAADRGYAFARRRYVLDALSLWKCRTPDGVAMPPDRYGGPREMKHDVIFATRLFSRQPGLFGVTIAGLAVAIGISTAVFSTVKAVAFGGYGVSAPESVFRVALTSGVFTRITGDSPFRGNWAFSDYARLRAATSSLSLVASARGRTEYRASPDESKPLPVSVLAVSGNYFQVLGIGASLGRTLGSADDAPGMPSVIVSHGFWRNQLGADRSVIGRTVWLGDRSFTVVGVAGRAHSTPSYNGEPPSFWMTLASHAEMWTGRSQASDDETRAKLARLKSGNAQEPVERERLAALESDLSTPRPAWNPAVDVFGRTMPGAARAQAEGEVRSVAASLQREFSPDRRTTVQLESLDEMNRGSLAIGAILMTAVGLVVFLACANVTNVLLASAASRRREIGTRLALGASRGRIVRQLLTESLLLGLFGGALGLVMAIGILPFFAAVVHVSPTFDVSPDLFVYAFVGFLTVAVGIIAGLAPARFGRGGDLGSALKTDQPTAPLPLPKRRLRSMLIGGQAAVSVVLLMVAALLIRAVVESAGLDVGYDVSRLMTVSVGNGARGRAWSAAQRDAYLNAALEQVRQLPGVAGASLASVPPFSDSYAPQMLNGRSLDRNETSPEYFSTVGIRLVKGRIYTAEEAKAGSPVAVISASLAREFWGTDDPVGASLERVWGSGDARLSGLLRQPPGTRIVGVVADATTRLQRQNALTIYLPLAASSVARLVIRAHDDPRALMRPVQNALETLDPSVRPRSTIALDGLRQELDGPKTLALLATAVGAIALGLAVIGLFGVTAFVVGQRAHEVGVRRALGASDVQLMRLLFRESLGPVAIGLASGLFAALLGGRAVQSVLYGVSSRDPVAIIVAVVVLLAAAIAAVFLPVRRATQVNPAQLLKMG